jgi:non-ribosomal peptide synthetase component F
MQLARRTEGRARQIAHHLIQIGVGHDDAVVLAHRLHTLAVAGAAFIDIVGDVRQPTKLIAPMAGWSRMASTIPCRHARIAGCPRARRLQHQFGKADRHRRIAPKA